VLSAGDCDGLYPRRITNAADVPSLSPVSLA